MTRNLDCLTEQTTVDAAQTQAAAFAQRLRQNASRQLTQHPARLSSFVIEHAIASDVGHLHAAHDLTPLPTVSHRRIAGPIVRRVKRALRRALHPLPEAQSTWNGANARVVTFLLQQLAAQAYAIESLEQQLSELSDEIHRQ